MKTGGNPPPKKKNTPKPNALPESGLTVALIGPVPDILTRLSELHVGHLCQRPQGSWKVHTKTFQIKWAAALAVTANDTRCPTRRVSDCLVFLSTVALLLLSFLLLLLVLFFLGLYFFVFAFLYFFPVKLSLAFAVVTVVDFLHFIYLFIYIFYT